MKWVLLDTNMLLAWLQQAQWGMQVIEKTKDRPDFAGFATSIICTGEIEAISKSNDWGRQKCDDLRALLDPLPTVDVSTPGVVDAYASIQAWTRGKPVESPRGAPPPKPAIPMSNNDLWIAATAHALDIPLMSSDSDFLHLDKTWLELIRVPVTK